MVQLGGLEPPTSCSTDRRSNQLSYNCILGRPQKGVPNGAETRCNAALWQGRERPGKSRKIKSPGSTPGLFWRKSAYARKPGVDHAAGLNSFDAFALIGSTVSVATFCDN
jgi:hypothetical protein